MADMALPLVTSGLFDRCPNVRVVFAHGNAGWAFHWLEFMDMMYVRRRHLKEFVLPNPDLLPSEYIRRNFWFTINRDRTAVVNRSLIGVSHLLWASHFPLDTANWPDDRAQAMRLTEELPADEQRALLAENTARLYRLPGYESGFDPDALATFDQLVHY
jgi:predicted TIM-barrel fold metal-dependent hydrolase